MNALYSASVKRDGSGSWLSSNQTCSPTFLNATQCLFRMLTKAPTEVRRAFGLMCRGSRDKTNSTLPGARIEVVFMAWHITSIEYQPEGFACSARISSMRSCRLEVK